MNRLLTIVKTEDGSLDDMGMVYTLQGWLDYAINTAKARGEKDNYNALRELGEDELETIIAVENYLKVKLSAIYGDGDKTYAHLIKQEKMVDGVYRFFVEVFEIGSIATRIYGEYFPNKIETLPDVVVNEVSNKIDFITEELAKRELKK